MKKLIMTSLMMVSAIAFCHTENNSSTSNNLNATKNFSAYPEDATNNNVEGTVFVYFEVANGFANNITVTHSVSPSLDNAAVDMVLGFTPEYLERLEDSGKKQYILPVEFDIR